MKNENGGVDKKTLLSQFHNWAERHREKVDFREVIYVIESPSPEDLLEQRHEGDALARILRLAEIDIVYFLATTSEMFDAAFLKISTAISEQFDLQTAMPFIHISAHGSDDGLELTDGDTIHWEKLTSLLTKLHEKIGPVSLPSAFPQNLPKVSICLSSCSAFEPYADHTENLQPPFQSLIGAIKDVGWCESLIAFSTFYYQTQILKKTVEEAVFAMNFSSGAVYGNELTYKVLIPYPPTEEMLVQFQAEQTVRTK